MERAGLGQSTNILVAPNSYKECASSAAAADLIHDQLAKHGFTNVMTFPISDGGDGFREVCKRNDANLQDLALQIRNSYNSASRMILGAFDRKSRTLILETAEMIGLKTIPKKYRKPSEINSENLGKLLVQLEARNRRRAGSIRKVIFGVGGTGTSDLGLGVSKAFGLQLFDAAGRELPVIPRYYVQAAKLVLPTKIDLQLEVVLDVEVPLFGKHGTSRVFASQKGADWETVNLLERGVKNILAILKRDHHIEMRDRLYGAGGGLLVGLSLIADIPVTSSREFLVDRLKLDEKIQWSDVVITGEGRFDRQSFMKKATGIVLVAATKRQKKIVMIVGSSRVPRRAFGTTRPDIYELASLFGSEQESMKHFRKAIGLTVSQISSELST